MRVDAMLRPDFFLAQNPFSVLSRTKLKQHSRHGICLLNNWDYFRGFWEMHWEVLATWTHFERVLEYIRWYSNIRLPNRRNFQIKKIIFRTHEYCLSGLGKLRRPYSVQPPRHTECLYLLHVYCVYWFIFTSTERHRKKVISRYTIELCPWFYIQY